MGVQGLQTQSYWWGGMGDRGQGSDEVGGRRRGKVYKGSLMVVEVKGLRQGGSRLGEGKVRGRPADCPRGPPPAAGARRGWRESFDGGRVGGWQQWRHMCVCVCMCVCVWGGGRRQ